MYHKVYWEFVHITCMPLCNVQYMVRHVRIAYCEIIFVQGFSTRNVVVLPFFAISVNSSKGNLT